MSSQQRGGDGSLPQRGVAWRIRRFLESHPGAPLTIAVRTLRIKGLAWLEPRVRDRRVRIVIGYWSSSHFKQATAADRQAALALLRRSDVVVRAWDPERPPPVLANARAWIAHTEAGPSVLLCSADLTDKGLNANWEVVAAVDAADRRQVADQVEAVAAEAENCKETILSLVAGDQGQAGDSAVADNSIAVAPTRPETGAAQRIEAFLDAHPHGRVTVAVGFASVSGLAWLSERLASRPVTVVIGNAQHRRFKNAEAGDRVAALAFLRRPDVQLLNWYRKHGDTPAEAHLKAWVVDGTRPGVLTGSANLTSAGLFNNREIMVETNGPDSASVHAQVRDLVRDAWDYKQELIGVIEQQPHAGQDKTERSANRVPTQPMTQALPSAGGRSGCLSVLVIYASLVTGTLLV
ncbi:MAG: hypothetical protein F4Z17_06395, partial [Acidimicrobiia bacterium]|nr:hypothetical protein [Acidimicrobiia bacterium]